MGGTDGKRSGNALIRSLEDVMRASRHAEGMTIREMVKETGHRPEWLRERLVALAEAGKLDVGRGHRQALDGTTRPVPVYKLK